MGTSDPPEGEITIDLGKSPSSRPGPTGTISLKVRSWTNIVATTAALAAGLAAFAKPPDHSAAKASYEELKKAVETNASNNKQNHEDIVALRNFLEGYVKGMAAPTASSAGPAPTAAKPAPLPAMHPDPKPQSLPDFDKVMKK